MSSPISVSYAKTVYGQAEIDAVMECLRQGTQMGKNAKKLEKEIADLFSKKHGLYVNSGSSALYIGMESLREVFNFSEGDEVITPALTFSTTVGSIYKAGLIPAYVDVGFNNYCVDVNQIESIITKKTVAISAPNLMGNVCEWDKISDIASRYNLKIIEDSADTLGATLHGKSSGAWSDMSITSFYGSHIINCAGNGGMLCVNNDEVMRQSKLLRSWGRSSSVFDDQSESIQNRFNVFVDDIQYDAKFLFEKIGYNLEGSEIGAAFGLVQLKSLEHNTLVREKNFQRQKEFFAQYNDFFVTPKINEGVRSGWLAFPVMLQEQAPFTRRDFQIYLEERNVQTRVVFTGNITRQPGYKNLPMKKSSSGYANADRVMKYGVLLACHHGMTDEMFDYMHSVIEDFIKKAVGRNAA
ncbi:MAG: DegT/DnrJ/EryC1/StrS family aminotransferase [Holosporales bacterium]